jgi:hypothetical protein
MADVLPTILDALDMNNFVTQHLKLVFLYEGYALFPHIFSWSSLKIRPADPVKDFIFEQGASDVAYVVEVEATQSFCEQISCNNHVRGEDRDCIFGQDSPSAFISYDQTMSQCEPACWTFGDSIVRTDKTKADSLFVMWDETTNTCNYGNQPLFMYFTDPISRSKARWERHVNTLPTGFRVEMRDQKLYAKMDDVYCKEFNLYLGDDNECKQEWYDIFAQFFPFSTTLVSLAESAARNNFETEPKEYDVPPDPSQISAARLDAEVWKSTIDTSYTTIRPDVLLSELGFSEEMLMPHTRAAFYYHNKERSILRIFNMVNQPSSPQHEYIRKSFNSPKMLKSTSPLQRSIIKSPNRLKLTNQLKLSKVKQFLRATSRTTFHEDYNHLKRDLVAPEVYSDQSDGQSDIEHVLDMASNFLANLPALFGQICQDWLGLTEMASQFLILKMLQKIKTWLLKIIERGLTNVITTLFEKISSRIFSATFENLISLAVSRIISSCVGKMMILAAKMAVATIDFIEWVQVIIAIVDIVYMLFDPFGMYNNIGQKDLDLITHNYHEGLAVYGMTKPEIDPTLYYNLLINMANDFGISDTFKSAIKSDGIERPFSYEGDENIFVIYASAFYLTSRTANSAGKLFNWDADTKTYGGSAVPTTIYQSMIRNVDAILQFHFYNYKQLAITLLFMTGLVLFIFSGFLMMVNVFAMCTILFAIYIKFSTSQDFTKIATSTLQSIFPATNSY